MSYNLFKLLEVSNGFHAVVLDQAAYSFEEIWTFHAISEFIRLSLSLGDDVAHNSDGFCGDDVITGYHPYSHACLLNLNHGLRHFLSHDVHDAQNANECKA